MKKGIKSRRAKRNTHWKFAVKFNFFSLSQERRECVPDIFKKCLEHVLYIRKLINFRTVQHSWHRTLNLDLSPWQIIQLQWKLSAVVMLGICCTLHTLSFLKKLLLFAWRGEELVSKICTEYFSLCWYRREKKNNQSWFLQRK